MSTAPVEIEERNLMRPYESWRCTALNRKRVRCGGAAVKGTNVCRMHGGASPQVQRKAAERLRELQHPALDRIERVLRTSDDDALATRVGFGVLDRTGLGPSSTVNVHAEAQLAGILAILDGDSTEVAGALESHVPELPARSTGETLTQPQRAAQRPRSAPRRKAQRPARSTAVRVPAELLA